MSFNICISHWSGRLGNNLFQLSSAIYFALKTKSTVTYHDHPIIKQHKFDFSESQNLKPIFHNFFYNKDFF